MHGKGCANPGSHPPPMATVQVDDQEPGTLASHSLPSNTSGEGINVLGFPQKGEGEAPISELSKGPMSWNSTGTPDVIGSIMIGVRQSLLSA